MTENAHPAPETSPTTPAPEATKQPASQPGGSILREKFGPYFDHAPPEMQDFLRKYGVTVLAGVAVGLLVVAGMNWYGTRASGKLAEADRLTFSAMATAPLQTEPLQKVLDEYPDSPSTPSATLLMAAANFQGGQYEMAGQMYEAFLTKYTNHPFRVRVELNVAICQEALGRLDAALATYASIGQRNPDSYIYPETVFGRGRCLEQLGRFAEAKAVYEDFIAGHPDSPSRQEAESEVEYVEKFIRAPQAPKAPTTPGAIAPLQISPAPAAPAAVPVAPAPAPSLAPVPAAPPAAAPAR